MKRLNEHMELTIAFLAVIVTLAVVHYLGYLLPYTYGIVQLMTGVLAAVWIATIFWRVTDSNIRSVLLTMAGNLLLLFTLQNARYNFFYGWENVRRILWYAFYLPMIMIPFLCFLMACNMDRGGKHFKDMQGITLLLPAVGLALCFLTNDFHQLAFHFTEGIENAVDKHRFGPIYYLYLLWAVVLLVLSVVLMLRKCLVSGSAIQLISLIPPFAFLLIFLLYYMVNGRALSFRGVTVLTMGDLYGLCTVWILECFLKIGLIPANHSYGELFRKTPIRALITDGEGIMQFASDIPLELTEEEKIACLDNSISLEENSRLSCRTITNGRCYWTDDMTKLNELEQSVRSVLASIEAQNEILRSENEVMKQRERLQAQNLLYDRIAEIVHPQAKEILALLQRAKSTPEEQRACIAEITVYNSYIKRRSNLELIRYQMNQRDGEKCRIAVEELRLSLIESLRSLELFGVETYLTGAEQGELEADLIIAAYETFQEVLENNVTQLEVLSAHVEAAEEELTLRMMIHLKEDAAFLLHADELNHKLNRSCRVVLQAFVREEEDDYTVRLTFCKGGGL